MQKNQRGSLVARAFLTALAASTIAACDSGNPLTPTEPGQRGVPETGARPPAARGPMLSREAARAKAIKDAQSALAAARSGAATSFSDGRRLTGPHAVTYWEDMLRALESGSSGMSVWRAAGSSPTTTARLTAADGVGYVAGSTLVTRTWSSAFVNAFTMGDGADNTSVDGLIDVQLTYTNPGGWWGYSTSKTLSAMYFGGGVGDYASASVQVSWDYNWFAEYAVAASIHSATYGDFVAETTSSGSA